MNGNEITFNQKIALENYTNITCKLEYTAKDRDNVSKIEDKLRKMFRLG